MAPRHGITVIDTSQPTQHVAHRSDPRLAPPALARAAERAALVVPPAAPQVLLDLERSVRSANAAEDA